MEENAACDNGGALMFTDEEVKEMSGFTICEDHVEITCGCTSHQYGDAVGTLRVFPNGDLEITCDCTPGCQEDKLTPAAFEKHSGRETARKWKNNIWVIANGEKVPVAKTVLLKYYNKTTKYGNGRSQNVRVGHRDEFVRCTVCGKMRRFRLRNKEECQVYHNALEDAKWKCSDTPYEKINNMNAIGVYNVGHLVNIVKLTSVEDMRIVLSTIFAGITFEASFVKYGLGRVACEDEEERASRRVYRGCSRSQTCKGCTSCVCFGCEICRFSDCSCQTCNDFTENAKT